MSSPSPQPLVAFLPPSAGETEIFPDETNHYFALALQERFGFDLIMIGRRVPGDSRLRGGNMAGEVAPGLLLNPRGLWRTADLVRHYGAELAEPVSRRQILSFLAEGGDEEVEPFPAASDETRRLIREAHERLDWYEGRIGVVLGSSLEHLTAAAGQPASQPPPAPPDMAPSP